MDLPEVPLGLFQEQLQGLVSESLADSTTRSLWAHYGELRRWGRRLSLIGPGTGHEVVARHYGESLQALDWCPRGALRHVDIGSGGGFPGFVLAAARPDWETTLMEPRERKWAFLKAAARAAELSCRPLNARVDARLPSGFPEHIGVVSVRALRLTESVWEAVVERLAKDGRVLWWQGDEGGKLPSCLRLVESRPLSGSRVRRIVWAERR